MSVHINLAPQPPPPKYAVATYRVEYECVQTDPKAAAAVLAWMQRWLPKPPAPKSVRTKLREFKARASICWGCSYTPPPGMKSRALHVHHVVPRHQGGTHDNENLVVLCARCHALAHAIARKRAAQGRRPFDQVRLLGRLLLMEGRRQKAEKRDG